MVSYCCQPVNAQIAIGTLRESDLRVQGQENPFTGKTHCLVALEVDKGKIPNSSNPILNISIFIYS